MERFLLVIKSNQFVVYKDESCCEPEHLNGSPYYEYETKRLTNNLSNLLNILLEEYNLNSLDDIKLRVITNRDAGINEIAINYLSKINVLEQGGTISVLPLLDKVYKKLSVIEDLFVSQYGINYDGVNYRIRGDGSLEEGNFKLLAYTAKDMEIISEI